MRRARLAIALLFLAGCGGGDGGADRGADRGADEGAGQAPVDTSAFVADTQMVVDSTGVVLEIVTRRSRSRARPIRPRAGSGDPDAPDVLRSLEPETVHPLLQAASPPWFVIDVRGARAYSTEGHLPNALLIPAEVLEQNIEDLHVRDDQTILLYGGEGNDAWRAARILASYGFPRVRVLEGGFPAWKRAGLPVEGGS